MKRERIREGEREEKWIVRTTMKLFRQHVLYDKVGVFDMILVVLVKITFGSRRKPHIPLLCGGLMLVRILYAPTIFPY
jgi:hypothetical protein